MREWINDCIKPIYRFHWADDIMDVEDKNSILLYVAIHDKRLWLQ